MKTEFKKDFCIYKSFVDKFFSRIDSKKQIIELIMETIRYILSYQKPPKENENVAGTMILYVDKMSRIFFFTKKKYFSIVLPFLAQEENSELTFSYNGVKIDHDIISKIIYIVKNNDFMSEDIYTFLEIFENDLNYWDILRDLMLIEDGYIRYDIDEEHFNIEKPKQHPLHHCDIFYSNGNTCKFGLDKPLIEPNNFIDLLNVRTDCYFMAP